MEHIKSPNSWESPEIPKQYAKAQMWRDFSWFVWKIEQKNKDGGSDMDEDRDDIIGSDPDKVGTEDVIKEIGIDEHYKTLLAEIKNIWTANIKRTYDSGEDANDRRRTTLDTLSNTHIATMNAITARIMTNAATYDNAVHEDMSSAKGKKNINLYSQVDEMAQVTTRAYSGDVAGTVNVASAAAAAISQFLAMSGIVITQVQPKETK